MGAFYAESLILAETGNSVGAIQIAGTAMPTQLPFFVAACDFTLIGEEFFAASAYLVGGLLLVAGCLIMTVSSIQSRGVPPDNEEPTYLQSASNYIIENILGKGGFKS